PEVDDRGPQQRDGEIQAAIVEPREGRQHEGGQDEVRPRQEVCRGEAVGRAGGESPGGEPDERGEGRRVRRAGEGEEGHGRLAATSRTVPNGSTSATSVRFLRRDDRRAARPLRRSTGPAAARAGDGGRDTLSSCRPWARPEAVSKRPRGPVMPCSDGP